MDGMSADDGFAIDRPLEAAGGTGAPVRAVLVALRAAARAPQRVPRPAPLEMPIQRFLLGRRGAILL